MILHLPLIIFSASITAIYYGNAYRALFRITETVEDPFLLCFLALSSYNFALFAFSLYNCRPCYNYSNIRSRSVRTCGAFWMVQFIIVAIVLLCVIFRDVFDDIDIQIGYQPSIFIVILLIGMLKALAFK